jgi:hypothetical protein
MKKTHLLLLAIALSSAVFGYPIAMSDKEGKEDAASEGAAFHLAYSMDKATYGNFGDVVKAETFDERIYGGIVSHHLLAAKQIAGFFAAFQGKEIRTVVIIGPNHFNAGNGNVLVSRYPYKTPWGTAEPDTEIIDALLSKKVVRNEEEPFGNEHSISSLVSFVRYYLPDARIVPIIVKRNASAAQADRLAAALHEILPQDAVVIASVDFSHHLDALSADYHDEKSVADINDFNYEGIAGSEIDSPISIRILLKYLEARGAKKMDWKNTSSAEILADPHYEDVTSYLFAHFFEGASAEENKTSILSLGDIYPERFDADANDIFEKIRGREGNFLRGADIISAGLSGSFSPWDCIAGKMTVKELGKSGINLLFLADTASPRCEEEMKTKGIGYFQTDAMKGENVFRAEKKGRKIAVVGVRGDSDLADFMAYYDKIAEIKRENDNVIVAVRWGAAKGSYFKKGIAHALIDSGADLVLGYGDEIGSMEKYHGKIIFYSLGSFPPGDGLGQNRLGVGAVFGNAAVRYYLFPLKMQVDRPELMTPQEAEVFCAGYLREIEGADGCRFETEND